MGKVLNSIGLGVCLVGIFVSMLFISPWLFLFGIFGIYFGHQIDRYNDVS